MLFNSVCQYFAARRKLAIAAFAVLALGAATVTHGERAYALTLDQSPAVSQTGDDAPLPIISVPTPVPANDDSCLPLLNAVRYDTSPASAMDRDRRSAGGAAALGLVFGLRFALGPQETSRSRHGSAVSFDVWQTRDNNSRRALAVADYRRCKNEQALKALSDWRWKR